MQTTAASKTHPRHGIDIELPAIFGMQLDLIFSRDSCGARHVSDCSRVVGKVWAVKSSFPSIHLPSSCRNIHDNPWESMRISSSSQVLATCSQEKICTSSWWQCVWHQDGPAISRVLGIYPGTVGCEGHQATVFELAAPTTIFRILRKVWEREILQLPVILQIFGLRDQETSVSTRAPARCIGSKLCWIWMNMNSISMNDSWTGFWNLGMHDIPRNWGHRKFWRYLFFPGSSKSETQLYCNLVTSAVVSSFSWVVIQNRFRADITHSLESIATKSSKVRSLTHWSSSLRKAMM